MDISGIKDLVEEIRNRLVIRGSDDTNEDASFKYKLPYGLCKDLGIDTKGMTPREAWDAYIKAGGTEPSSAYQAKAKSIAGVSGRKTKISTGVNSSHQKIEKSAIYDNGSEIADKKVVANKHKLYEAISDGKLHKHTEMSVGNAKDLMGEIQNGDSLILKGPDGKIKTYKNVGSKYFRETDGGKYVSSVIPVAKLSGDIASSESLGISKPKGGTSITHSGKHVTGNEFEKKIEWSDGKITEKDVDDMKLNSGVQNAKKAVNTFNKFVDESDKEIVPESMTFSSSGSSVECYVKDDGKKKKLTGSVSKDGIYLKDKDNNVFANLMVAADGEFYDAEEWTKEMSKPGPKHYMGYEGFVSKKSKY